MAKFVKEIKKNVTKYQIFEYALGGNNKNQIKEKGYTYQALQKPPNAREVPSEYLPICFYKIARPAELQSNLEITSNVAP